MKTTQAATQTTITYGVKILKEGKHYWIHENNMELTRDILCAKVFHHAETAQHWIEYLQSLPQMEGATIQILRWTALENEDLYFLMNVRPETTGEKLRNLWYKVLDYFGL